jgi:hypothetical protein
MSPSARSIKCSHRDCTGLSQKFAKRSVGATVWIGSPGKEKASVETEAFRYGWETRIACATSYAPPYKVLGAPRIPAVVCGKCVRAGGIVAVTGSHGAARKTGSQAAYDQTGRNHSTLPPSGCSR